MFECNYEDVVIRVVQGDITQQIVDAIVNPANSRMIMGGGVAGAIKRAGGKEIEEEAIKQAPVPVGKAIATTAGKLRALYVIHTPTMSRPAMRITKENVESAMKAALECAKKLKIKSIAFPGLGTGVGGVPIQTAATAMVQQLKNHLDEGTSIKEVTFVGFTQESAEAFKKAVKQLFLQRSRF
jgi:O-acetyl-ADP-ribose deacetylase (regulator of RNase III)